MTALLRLMIRKLSDITENEIDEIRVIISNCYYGDEQCTERIHWIDIEYQLFTKSRACYSGKAVVKVYQYLQSIGIEVFND